MRTEAVPKYFIDVADEICPFTYVKAKLLLETMPVGATASIRLKGEEPLTNVLRSAREDGHAIVSWAPDAGGEAYVLTVKKG